MGHILICEVSLTEENVARLGKPGEDLFLRLEILLRQEKRSKLRFSFFNSIKTMKVLTRGRFKVLRYRKERLRLLFPASEVALLFETFNQNQVFDYSDNSAIRFLCHKDSLKKYSELLEGLFYPEDLSQEEKLVRELEIFSEDELKLFFCEDATLFFVFKDLKSKMRYSFSAENRTSEQPQETDFSTRQPERKIPMPTTKKKSSKRNIYYRQEVSSILGQLPTVELLDLGASWGEIRGANKKRLTELKLQAKKIKIAFSSGSVSFQRKNAFCPDYTYSFPNVPLGVIFPEMWKKIFENGIRKTTRRFTAEDIAWSNLLEHLQLYPYDTERSIDHHAKCLRKRGLLHPRWKNYTSASFPEKLIMLQFKGGYSGTPEDLNRLDIEILNAHLGVHYHPSKNLENLFRSYLMFQLSKAFQRFAEKQSDRSLEAFYGSTEYEETVESVKRSWLADDQFCQEWNGGQIPETGAVQKHPLGFALWKEILEAPQGGFFLKTISENFREAVGYSKVYVYFPPHDDPPNVVGNALIYLMGETTEDDLKNLDGFEDLIKDLRKKLLLHPKRSFYRALTEWPYYRLGTDRQKNAAFRFSGTAHRSGIFSKETDLSQYLPKPTAYLVALYLSPLDENLKDLCTEVFKKLNKDYEEGMVEIFGDTPFLKEDNEFISRMERMLLGELDVGMSGLF